MSRIMLPLSSAVVELVVELEVTLAVEAAVGLAVELAVGLVVGFAVGLVGGIVVGLVGRVASPSLISHRFGTRNNSIEAKG